MSKENKITKWIGFVVIVATLAVLTIILVACPGKLAPSVRPTDTVTMAEMAEAAVSGAVTATNGSLTQARYAPGQQKSQSVVEVIKRSFNFLPKANAATSQGACPTFQAGMANVVAANTNCIVSTNAAGFPIMTLQLAPCNMGLPFATWSGTQVLSFNAATTTAFTCAAPLTFQNLDNVQRFFAAPSSRITNFVPPTPFPSPSPNIVTVLVDTYGATPGYTLTSGWYYPISTTGEAINFTGPITRNIVINGIHVVGAISNFIMWDYTISTVGAANSNIGGQPIVVDAGNNVTSGIVVVQDNLNKAVTLNTFGASESYGASSCGIPTSGTVTESVVTGNYTPHQLAFSATCGQGTYNGNAVNLMHAF